MRYSVTAYSLNKVEVLYRNAEIAEISPSILRTA